MLGDPAALPPSPGPLTIDAERHLEQLAPLPLQGTVQVRSRLLAVHPRGKGGSFQQGGAGTFQGAEFNLVPQKPKKDKSRDIRRVEEELSDLLTAEVEVRVAPDGTILSRKLIQASGNKAWDDAVLKAIDKPKPCPATPMAGCSR